MSFAQRDVGVIESFAAHLGLPARPASDGSFSFVFDGAATLTFTPSDAAGIVLSVTREAKRADAETMRRALASGGYDAELGLVFGVGMSSDESLIHSVHIDENQISLPTIETCLHHLLART